VVTQGAQVSAWTAYTPTITGLGTGTLAVNTGFYRRVGDTLECAYTIQMGTAGSGATAMSASLPTGYTVNTSAIPDGTLASGDVLGTGNFVNISGSVASAYYATSTTVSYVVSGASLAGSAFTSGAYFVSRFTVPVNELAGSGTVNVAQNDVQYAWNSTATTTSDTTGTNNGYGPGGVLFQSFAPTGIAAITKRVTFQYPVPVGTKPSLEVDGGSGGIEWNSLSDRLGGNGFNAAGTAAWGYRVINVSGSNTQFDVLFYATYDQVTTDTWAGASAWRWRLTAANPGVAVGFSNYNPGVSAGLVSVQGLPGSTSGSSPGAGYAGESFTGGASLSAVTSTYNATEAWATTGTMNLTAGNWLITATGSGYTTVPSAGSVGCDIRMQDTTNSVTVQLANDVAAAASTLVAGNDNEFGFSTTGYRTISSTATVAIQIGASANSGTPTSGACNTRANGVMYAIRMP
jgi:hypothetical protein